MTNFNYFYKFTGSFYTDRNLIVENTIFYGKPEQLGIPVK